MLLRTLWFILLFSITLIYAIVSNGFTYIFKRKEAIVNGLLDLVEDYTQTADILSFKHYVEGLDITRYSPIFIAEFLEPLKKDLEYTYSSKALGQQLNNPLNAYYELQKFKDFLISSIESDDASIRKALKTAIETSKENKKIYVAKMGTTTFINYLVIGMMYIFPFIFVVVFLSTLGSVNIGGLTKAGMIPTQLQFNLWFIMGTITSLLLMVGSNYYMNKEAKAITTGFYTLLVLTLLSSIMYITILVI